MSKVFYETLLAKFMKANKTRRQQVAEKAGYKTADEYKNFLLESIESSVETIVEPVEVEDEISALDMVIAFDTTGSMSSYIASVRKHVKELIPQLFENSPKLRLQIIAFGDYCDMRSKTDFGKAYQVSAMTINQNLLIDFVNKAIDTSGGDGDEFYELVIKKITEETPWRTEAKKAVLLIADANPHKVGYSYNNIVRNAQIDWKEEAKKAADLGIQFDTLKINTWSKWMEELSSITNGLSLDFKTASKTSNVVEGLAYARSSKAAYTTAMSSVEASGDEELIGAYKQMGELL